ncbi:helix-turn-helix domain-containing protein [Spartinivicinus ruber]|uniref:helix-turn-helix domain-containing protein n=1 Tax=Spartinivicinus ruber TaxID=2683272 RepID=UPI0013D2622D|nr:helix-turn-helix domain-containing protein [Spartinivicinus ruber]
MSEIWKKLRARRRELDLTQKEVADYCEVSVTSVSQWESQAPERQAFPRQDKIQKLSEILQVDTNWFYSDDEDSIFSAVSILEEDEYQKAKAKVNERQMSSLWSKLRKRRKELNLTQGEIAKYCEVSLAAVGKWESKDPETRAYPKRNKLQKLSEVLKVNHLWLLDGNESLSATQEHTDKISSNSISPDPAFWQEQMRIINTYTDLVAKNKLTPADLKILDALAEYIINR